MRYAIVALLTLSACDRYPLWPLPASIEFVSASLNATTVATGSQFVASARVSYSNCDSPLIQIDYGTVRRGEHASTIQATLTAAAGDSIVSFAAYCDTAVAVPIQVLIQVTTNELILVH